MMVAQEFSINSTRKTAFLMAQLKQGKMREKCTDFLAISLATIVFPVPGGP